MNKLTIPLSCMLLFTFCKKEAAQPPPPIVVAPPVNKEYSFETTPIWQDEFDYTGAPDSTKWGYDIGGSGWGNHELQYYTNSTKNANVKDGKLILSLLREYVGGKDYSSARLVTKGKGDFLYGKVQIKAKLPMGKGTWPAIWMLPTDWEYGDWPKSGEIDIMEHVGYDQNNIHFSTHSEAYYFKINTQKSANQIVSTASTDFHIYGLEWTPTEIKGLIDDSVMFTFKNEGGGYTVWPFDKRFHLLLNIAFGGDWGGAQGFDNSSLPQKMEVDYIRVYKMIETIKK